MEFCLTNGGLQSKFIHAAVVKKGLESINLQGQGIPQVLGKYMRDQEALSYVSQDLFKGWARHAYDISFPEEAKKPNPHLWTDPILALKYAEIVKEQLIVLDNNNDQYFINNYNKFKKRIELLDESIKLAVSTIDPAKRKLLTYHDSFPFFAKRYGFEIIGAVKPSDFSEPSSKELAELIDQIKKEDMQVIFGSRMFPSVVMSQIAKETGAKYVDKLRDDDLPGIISEKDHSYLGLMVANLRVIVNELGGDVKFFDNIEVGNVFSEISTAVYP